VFIFVLPTIDALNMFRVGDSVGAKNYEKLSKIPLFV